jgi:hypothetical protein
MVRMAAGDGDHNERSHGGSENSVQKLRISKLQF